jgi:hypothetical protein
MFPGRQLLDFVFPPCCPVCERSSTPRGLCASCLTMFSTSNPFGYPASFIKFFGVSFLSRTSALVTTRVASHPRLEVGWTMQLPQVALALACVLLGVLPFHKHTLEGRIQRQLAYTNKKWGCQMRCASSKRYVSLSCP